MRQTAFFSSGAPRAREARAWSSATKKSCLSQLAGVIYVGHRNKFFFPIQILIAVLIFGSDRRLRNIANAHISKLR